MASVTFTVPDPVLNRVLDGFAAHNGWTAGSGLTKAQFLKQSVIDFVRSSVIEAEAAAARNAVAAGVQPAADAARAQAQIDISIS